MFEENGKMGGNNSKNAGPDVEQLPGDGLSSLPAFPTVQGVSVRRASETNTTAIEQYAFGMRV